MIGTDPATAAPRADLPYLRRRSRRPAAPAAGPLGEFLAGRSSRAQQREAQQREAQQREPQRDGPAPQPTPDRAAASSSLDLSHPARPPASSSLGLSSGAGGAPRRQQPAVPQRRARPQCRVRGRGQVILTASAPTVTLTRLQSGIGTLSFTAACSAEVGDLRLGCAYQLASGESSTLQSSGGIRFAPPRSRRPVIVGGREQYERISVDLRQCRQLERLAIYGFSASRAPLSWGGTLVASTLGGAEVEVPLEGVQGEVVMLMTLYNVDGEFVLRAEMQAIVGDVREACRAYGYDRITWLDSRTPVD